MYFLCLLLDLWYPVVDWLQGMTVGDIVHKHNDSLCCMEVVGGGNFMESFLCAGVTTIVGFIMYSS